MIEKGQIVIFRTKKRYNPFLFVAVLIGIVQKCVWTHAALIMCDECRTIVESRGRGVQKSFLDNDFYTKNFYYAVLEPIDITKSQLDASVRYATSALSEAKYDHRGIWELFKWYLAERILGIKIRQRIPMRDNPNKFFCIEFASFCYKQTGYEIDRRLGFKDYSAITTGDIVDNIEKFKLIETNVPGGKILRK